MTILVGTTMSSDINNTDERLKILDERVKILEEETGGLKAELEEMNHSIKLLYNIVRMITDETIFRPHNVKN